MKSAHGVLDVWSVDGEDEEMGFFFSKKKITNEFFWLFVFG